MSQLRHVGKNSHLLGSRVFLSEILDRSRRESWPYETGSVSFYGVVASLVITPVQRLAVVPLVVAMPM